MNISRYLILLGLLCTPLKASWEQDFEKAKIQAATEQKDLYLIFTSLQTSGACVQLNKRVLSQASFQNAVSDTFILVHLDLPAEAPEDEKDPFYQNAQIAQKFPLTEFPTAFYLDSQGRPYFQESGALMSEPEKFATRIIDQAKAYKMRQAAFKAAYQKEGLTCAQELIDLIKAAPEGSQRDLEKPHLAALARLDPDDTLGFQKNYHADRALEDLEISISLVFHKDSYAQVTKLVDTYIEEHSPQGQRLQKVLFRKLAALKNGNKTDEALLVAEQIIASDPNSSWGKFATSIQQQLKAR